MNFPGDGPDHCGGGGGEDGRLVVHDGAHVDSERIHILANEDPVLLAVVVGVG